MRNRNPPGIRVDDRLGMTTTTEFRLLPFRGVRFNLSATRQATVPHDSTCPIGRAHRTTLYDLQVVGNAIEASSSPEHVEASRMPWPEPDSWKGSSPSGTLARGPSFRDATLHPDRGRPAATGEATHDRGKRLRQLQPKRHPRQRRTISASRDHAVMPAGALTGVTVANNVTRSGHGGQMGMPQTGQDTVDTAVTGMVVSGNLSDRPIANAGRPATSPYRIDDATVVRCRLPRRRSR